MRIITVAGARPQFIKAAAESRAIRVGYSALIEKHILNTGQHFDDKMSQVFFDVLQIPSLKYHFAVSGSSHGSMTGKVLEAIGTKLMAERPDSVLISGDSNYTLSGALAAAKLRIPVALAEAGLRSFTMHMLEEIKRILAYRVSSLLFDDFAFDSTRIG